MKYFSVIAIVAAFAIWPSAAHSQEEQDGGAYVSAGTATWEFDNYGVDVKAGYDFTENLAVEFQGTVGIDSVREDFGVTVVTTKIEHTIGGFIVARLPLTEQFSGFVRGGYHDTNINIVSTDGGDPDQGINGIAAGAGFEVDIGTSSAIRAEFTYLDGDRQDLNLFSLSLVQRF